MITRRKFLAHSSLISLAPMIPGFLNRSLANESTRVDDTILVVLQLDGGNDGLNTVIPYRNDHYLRSRRELRIAEKDVVKLNDELGLHPAMKPMAEMYQAGRLTILPGVGYPNPDRSHFRSMAIWHQGRPDADENSGYGWLGRTLDTTIASTNPTANAVFVGSQNPPQALWGRRSQVVSLNHANDFRLSTEFSTSNHRDQESSHDSVSINDVSSYVNRVVRQTYQSARQFTEQIDHDSSKSISSYPDSELAQQLSLISLMIRNNLGARVYYASQTGYDTHSGQLGPHQRLLGTLAGALKAFFDDLAAARLDDRVVLLAFSEFGRRVQENESEGTDHGAAGPVFLAGPETVGGISGQYPSLEDLDEGDLKMSVDFRSVYRTILDDWLRIDSRFLVAEEKSLRLFK
ncbi:MAG: DUF1501 domain-containing protein [Planctomycetes bacterium]|nr:DUF1501 domain-containing protein [Planctomycetota bacterium]